MNDGTKDVPDRSCPSCGAQLAAIAVLCVDCGYDTRTGTRLRPSTNVEAQAEDVSSNPYQSPTTSEDRPASNGSVLTKFVEIFSLRGRVSRLYWWSVHIAFALMECVFAAMEVTETSLGSFEDILMIPVLMFLWVIFATHVKRWHDIDRSGWWWLVNSIPLLGWLYSLVELGFDRGTEGPNEYGEDPRRDRTQKTK